MTALIPFPNIDPVLISWEVFGMTLAIRWYALAYIVGLLLAWRWIVILLKRPALWKGDKPPMSLTQPEDLLTWMIFGIILGGRLGFVLFYQPAYYFANPSEILKVWEGGMSFHGGAIGVLVATMLFCWKNKLPVWSVGDAVAISAPIGLFLGRLANFINGELWGRPTTMPWGVIFPGQAAQTCPDWWLDSVCARHPSQLYEAALEGLVLFILLSWLALRRGWLKKPGQLFGMFLIGYGVARTIVEGFRQGDMQFVGPDNPWGLIIRMGSDFDSIGLSMGQILSLPMVAAGLIIVIWVRRRA
jgi:phosphatidylglycerol---prolipoprotein diacylglyceryl transferase